MTRKPTEHVEPFEPLGPVSRPFGMLDPVRRILDSCRLDRAYRRLSRVIDRWRSDAVLVHPCRFQQAPGALRYLASPTLFALFDPPRLLHEPSVVSGWGLVPPPRTWRDIRVEFRQGIPDDELVDLYRGATLTLFAPVLEPLGLVPLESAACGTPVVGIREGGVRETIVDGVSGRLAPRDPVVFARIVVELLEDPRRHDFGLQGRALIEMEWTWEASIRRLEELLCDARHESSTGRRVGQGRNGTMDLEGPRQGLDGGAAAR